MGNRLVSGNGPVIDRFVAAIPASLRRGDYIERLEDGRLMQVKATVEPHHAWAIHVLAAFLRNTPPDVIADWRVWFELQLAERDRGRV